LYGWDNAILNADQIIRHTNLTLADRFVRLVSSDRALLAG
jgi:hypothetical protein